MRVTLLLTVIYLIGIKAEGCYKVRLTKINCTQKEDKSDQLKLVGDTFAIQNDQNDLQDEYKNLKQENEQLKNNVFEKYSSLENDLNLIKLKMFDWKEQQDRISEQYDKILELEKIISTLRKRNIDLTAGKNRRLKKIANLQIKNSKLRNDFLSKRNELAASDVKNEVLYRDMRALQREIREARDRQIIMDNLYQNITTKYLRDCKTTQSGSTSIEGNILPKKLIEAHTEKIKMFEVLSSQLSQLQAECGAVMPEYKAQMMKVSTRKQFIDKRQHLNCYEKRIFKNVSEVADLIIKSVLSKTSPKVVCGVDDDSNYWIIIQRRLDGSVDFKKGWNDYVNGFGDLNGEFWLGLEAIHQLTKNNNYMLRIDLLDWYGMKWFAEYDLFSVGPGEGYALNVTGYRGNIRFYEIYSFERLSGMKFTTIDKDQDVWRYNCASYRYNGKFYHSGGGGWWYRSCSHVNLNGKYIDYSKSNIKENSQHSHTDGIFWHSNKPTGMLTRYSFKHVEMKIRLKYYK